MELVLGTVRAERTLIAADARPRCAWRKVLVAIFAVRPELQRHDCLVMSWRGRSWQIKRQTRMTNTPRFQPCWKRYRCNFLSGSFELFLQSIQHDRRANSAYAIGPSARATMVSATATNFKALFESIEGDQVRRDVLTLKGAAQQPGSSSRGASPTVDLHRLLRRASKEEGGARPQRPPCHSVMMP